MYRGGINEQRGKTKEERRRLYYSACIWVRVLLAFVVGVLCFYFPAVMGLILAVCAALTMIGNIGIVILRGIDSVWWNRAAEAVFSMVIMVLGIMLYFGKMPWYMPSIALVVNIVYGIALSFIVNPYKAAPVPPERAPLPLFEEEGVPPVTQ